MCLALTVAYPVQIADEESDIVLFNKRHTNDTSVLFFVNQDNEEQQSGFWASIFNLFGSTSGSDETYLKEIADNNPLLKIDIGRESLQHSADVYEVKTVPYVIAYHRGTEILRETPTAKTAGNIEQIVKNKEEERLKEIDNASTVHPERDPSKVDIWDNKTDTDEHHHPKPLVITPDFGHLDMNDPAESSLIKSRPVQALDDQTGANIAESSKTVDRSSDPIVDYKLRNTPEVEDPTVAAATPAAPKMKLTDGSIGIPVDQTSSTPSSRPSGPQSTRPAVAVSKPANTSAGRPSSASTGRPARPAASPYRPSSGTVQNRLSNSASYSIGSSYSY